MSRRSRALGGPPFGRLVEGLHQSRPHSVAILVREAGAGSRGARPVTFACDLDDLSCSPPAPVTEPRRRLQTLLERGSLRPPGRHDDRLPAEHLQEERHDLVNRSGWRGAHARRG